MCAMPMRFADRTTASRRGNPDRRYEAVFDAVNDGIFVADLATARMIDVNDSGCRMFGYDKNELIGQQVDALSSGVHPYTREVAAAKRQSALLGEVQRFEWQCRTRSGCMFWADVSLRCTTFGPTSAIVASVRDITEARQQRESFRQLAENITDAFWMSNPEKTKMLYVSPGYEAIWGRSCQSLYDNPRQWLDAIHEADRERILERAGCQAHDEYDEEYRVVRPDGAVRWVCDRAFPVRDEYGAIYRIAGVARDITESKRLDAQITHMARHDALTGLANRSMFSSTLERAIVHGWRSGTSLAVLFVDLDCFKDINALHGHAVGDQLVRLVAERLDGGLRFNETAFRIGGDQFAILLGDAGEPAEVGAVADRLIHMLGNPFVIDGREVHVGASIGIAISGETACDPITLMSHAESALYRAKGEGRGTYRFYSAAMDRDVRSRIALTEELRLAIPAGQLFVVYQPQVQASDGRIVGLEALVRWDHPDRGVLGPDSFLPVAESSGLIVALDRWVLRQACRQGREWIDAGVSPGRICVNQSSAQFRQPLELERFVLATFEETGLPANALELEMTETTFIGFSAEHRSMMQRLRSAGVSFSLDDFGTGFSSLNYLRRFSVDRIKIAREFISDLTSSGDSAAIVKCILNLARDLGSDVIAEGVETPEQLALLQGWDCQAIQGFYFAAPMTAEAVSPLLAFGAISPSNVN
jgi:diguanylate cyclase (GGDEF)-like protein/PAS domain S-box-containing protein